MEMEYKPSEEFKKGWHKLLDDFEMAEEDDEKRVLYIAFLAGYKSGLEHQLNNGLKILKTNVEASIERSAES